MTIMLVAGGSGGHIFPAIAVAEECNVHKKPVVLLTDARGNRFLSSYRHLFQNIYILPCKKFKPYNLCAHAFKSMQLLMKIKPKAVLGFGGQITFLPLLLARILNIKCGIHQSDIVMGKANKWLSLLVHQTFVAYNGTGKGTVIGMPIRKAFQNIPDIVESKYFNIIILGGSQGAHIWSELMPKAIGMLSENEQKLCKISHQAPLKDMDLLKETYSNTSAEINLFSFTEEMSALLQQSHIVFSRAGASTLAELMAAGRPAFLIPYPYATQNHQLVNSQYVVQQKGGWMCLQKDATPEKIYDFLHDCLHNTSKLLYAGERMKKMFQFNAAHRLFQFCLNT